DRVRRRLRPEDVQRSPAVHVQASALAGREAPVTVVRAQGRAGAIDDGALSGTNALTLEERAVVVAAEEARLLALRTLGGRESRRSRLRACLVLRLVAEGEADALEDSRIDVREHVRLVLSLVDRAAHEASAVPLDHAGVVPRPQFVGARTFGESHELVE